MMDQDRGQRATVGEAGATPSEDARLQRYRQAERALWSHYGLEPTERFIDLDSPAVRLRVLEVGSGEPVLFIHGTAGAGPVWAPLIRELSGFRCLVLDRPGWGLSSALDYDRHEYRTLVADLLRGAVDALGVDRTHVVGGSIGNLWALRLAARHPSRVDRVVLVGGGPLVPELRLPVFIRLLVSPVGALMVRLPEKPASLRRQLRQLGHRASLEAGHIPNEFLEWHMALTRDTDSMPNERAMVRAIVSRGSFRPGLALEEGELAGIAQPTLYVYGTADPVGTVDTWRRVVGLLPRAELHLVDGGGHVPWFDDPKQVGAHVSRFLASGSR